MTSQAIVDVDVGTPPTPHTLHIDTGSATTWIVTAECVASTDLCPNNSGVDRTGYSPSNASSPMNTNATMDYLGGVVTGRGVRDAFSFPSNTSLAWSQSFMAADKSSWFNIPADGFLGLAFSSISDANTASLVETMMQDGLLDEPRFGLYYGTNTQDSDGSDGGVLTLGGSKETEYISGDMKWANLETPGDNAQLWRVSMRSLLGTKPVSPNDTTGQTVSVTIPAKGTWGVFDSGAARIAVPDPYIQTIYDSIGMNYTAIKNGEVIPLCEDFTDAWSVEFSFGDASEPTRVTLTGDMLKTPGFASGEDKYCWPPFDTSGSDGLYLFGEDFLSLFYTVFDFGAFEPVEYQARIGFGSLKEEFRPTS